MAIQFARIEYGSRSSGGNACRSAAYNAREILKCERTGELFYFRHKSGSFHHEILLPEGADDKFKDLKVLWNEAENREKRVNSQVYLNMVLALPDNPEITNEMRIEMIQRYIEDQYVSKGLAAQIDGHYPDKGEKNYHAHVMLTTRRFTEDGLHLGEKARDLFAQVRKGIVVEAPDVGKNWAEFQNEYFKEKGLNIRVDPLALVAQEHLGPVRMRDHMNDALKRAELIREANEYLATDAAEVIKHLTRNKAVISERDFKAFADKHVPSSERKKLHSVLFEKGNLLKLYDVETGKFSGLYTTKAIREEEEKLIRFTAKSDRRGGKDIDDPIIQSILALRSLSQEQQQVFEYVLDKTKGVAIVQGRAGTGKSYTMGAIREAYASAEYRVQGLAPTNVVASDMRENGFTSAKSIHAFLFRYKNGREYVDKDTVIVVDEAGMVSTDVLVELFNVAKNHSAKVVLFGDDRQLSSISRGGMFSLLAEKYGACELKEVRRQLVDWQKEMSEHFSEGRVKEAVTLLEQHQKLHWSESKEQVLQDLVNYWSDRYVVDPEKQRFILAHKNVDVDALNLAVRDIMRARGVLRGDDCEIMTTRGRVCFAVGDQVQFVKTDKSINAFNGTFGQIVHIDEKRCDVRINGGNDQIISFDPTTFKGLRHGYAGTVYSSQGKSISEVYVLRDGHSRNKLDYVGLTRHKEDLHVFISKDQTKDIGHLVAQMQRNDKRLPSLAFTTEEELIAQKRKQEQPELLPDLYQKAGELVKEAYGNFKTNIKDRFHSNEGFYNPHIIEDKTHHAVIKKEALAKEELVEVKATKSPWVTHEESLKAKEYAKEMVMGETKPFSLQKIPSSVEFNNEQHTVEKTRVVQEVNKQVSVASEEVKTPQDDILIREFRELKKAASLEANNLFIGKALNKVCHEIAHHPELLEKAKEQSQAMAEEITFRAEGYDRKIKRNFAVYGIDIDAKEAPQVNVIRAKYQAIANEKEVPLQGQALVERFFELKKHYNEVGLEVLAKTPEQQKECREVSEALERTCYQITKDTEALDKIKVEYPNAVDQITRRASHYEATMCQEKGVEICGGRGIEI